MNGATSMDSASTETASVIRYLLLLLLLSQHSSWTSGLKIQHHNHNVHHHTHHPTHQDQDVWPLAPHAAAMALKLGPSFYVEPAEEFYFHNDTGGMLDCLAQGIPAPLIKWYRQTSAERGWIHLQPDSHDLWTILPHNSSLSFRPFSPHEFNTDVHQNVYHCKAVSESGTILSNNIQVKAMLRQTLSARVVLARDKSSSSQMPQITVGNSVQLRCEVPHLATMPKLFSIVDWFKDASLAIERHDKGHLHLANGDLVIINVTPEMSGWSYFCKLFNILTKEEVTSAPFSLNIEGHLEIGGRIQLQRPMMQDASYNYVEVLLGQTAILPCFSIGTPAPITSWFKESHHHLLNPLDPNSRYVELNGALIINDVHEQDQGSFRCVARNSGGESSKTVHLSVRYPLKIRVQPEVQVADVGQKAIFHCTFTEKDSVNFSEDKISSDKRQWAPSENFLWLKDGQPVKNRQRVRVSGHKSGTLEVLSVFKDDAGVYQCFGNHSGSQYQAPAELRLGDAAPNFQYAFIEQTLQPGPFVSLKCSATGSPTPQVLWKLDGFPIPQSERFMIGQYVSVHGDVISNLNISNSRIEDGGLYSCEAISRAGSQLHSARLNIYGPPVVRQFPEQVRAVEGRPFVLHCPVGGFPIQEVIWIKDGKGLVSDLHRTVHANGTIVVGEVVKQREEGQYLCKARNRHGQSAETSTHLQVMVSPKIVPFSSVARLQRGERITITCTLAKGDAPLSISWLKDGSLIDSDSGQQSRSSHRARSEASSSSGLKVITFDHFNSVLTIESLELKHMGNYTCQASNMAGTASYSQAIHVNVPPNWVLKPQDREVISGQPVELQCLAEGSPKPSIVWKKESVASRGGDFLPILGTHPVSGSSMVSSSNGSLMFSHVQPEQGGRYLCQVDNGIGQSLHQIVNLTIKVPPKILSQLSSSAVRAARGEKRVQLECNTEGDLPIKVKWTRNGEDVMMGADRGRFALETHIKPAASAAVSGMSSILSLTDVTKEDEAAYECSVSNPYGKTSHIVKLVVQEPPKAPSDLQVVEVTSYSARITWQPANGPSPLMAGTDSDQLQIKKYIIEWSPVQDPWDSEDGAQNVKTESKGFSSKLDLPGHLQSATISDLTPHIHYKVKIAAENLLGRGEASQQVTFWTLGDKPSGLPARLQARSPAPDALLIEWEDPPRHEWNGELLGYRAGWKIIDIDVAPSSDADLQSGHLSDSLGSGYNWTEVERYDINDLKLFLRGLQPYTPYDILIQAFNQFGRGPTASIKSFTLSDVPRSSPEEVSCKTLGPHSVRIKWNLLAKHLLRGKLIGHKIHVQEVDVDGPRSGGGVHLVAPPATTFDLLNLTPFSNYSIMVAAETEQRLGPWSAPIFCLTESSILGPPTDIKVVSTSDSSVIISWLPPEKASGGITSYTLYKRYKTNAMALDSGMETEKSVLPKNADFSQVHGLKSGVYYQFFVTANSNAGEGNASTVVGFRSVSSSEKPSVQIISIGRTVVARQTETVFLPCKFSLFASSNRHINDNRDDRTIEMDWIKDQDQDLRQMSQHNRIAARRDVLQIEQIRATDAGNYTCKVRSVHDHQFDQVTYHLIVQDRPQKPKLKLLSSHPDHLELNISPGGELQRPVNPTLLFCTLTYKALFGSVSQLRIPGGELDRVRIGYLECGKRYDVGVVCSNALGQSEPSDLLQDVQTLGSRPSSPTRPSDFVHPTNVSVRLDLYTWQDDVCPVDYFVVSYKKSKDPHWTLVSNNLKTASRRFTIRQLDPETSYELRVRANNQAGSTEFKYTFETVSTLRASGAHLGTADNSRGDQDHSDSEDNLLGQIQILLPILLGIAFVVIVVASVAFCLKKKDMIHHDNKSLYLSGEEGYGRKFDDKISHPNQDFLYTPPMLVSGQEGPPVGQSAYLLQQQPHTPKAQKPYMDTMSTAPESAEDIAPYATFILPESHVSSRPSQQPTSGKTMSSNTIGKMDMLILHENPTLPLSDACSKSSTSNPYTTVHRPKRRRKRHRGVPPQQQQLPPKSLAAQAASSSCSVGTTGRAKQPQMGLSFRKHQIELMQKANIVSQQPPPTPGKHETRSLSPTSTPYEDTSSYSSSNEDTDTYQGPPAASSRTESSNQLDQDDLVWIPKLDLAKYSSYTGTLPPPNIDTDTLPSSEPEELQQSVYNEQSEDTDGGEKIFIKQNKQFVGVKPHEISFHAQSHLIASPRATQTRQSMEARRRLSSSNNDYYKAKKKSSKRL